MTQIDPYLANIGPVSDEAKQRIAAYLAALGGQFDVTNLIGNASSGGLAGVAGLDVQSLLAMLQGQTQGITSDIQAQGFDPAAVQQQGQQQQQDVRTGQANQQNYVQQMEALADATRQQQLQSAYQATGQNLKATDEARFLAMAEAQAAAGGGGRGGGRGGRGGGRGGGGRGSGDNYNVGQSVRITEAEKPYRDPRVALYEQLSAGASEHGQKALQEFLFGDVAAGRELNPNPEYHAADDPIGLIEGNVDPSLQDWGAQYTQFRDTVLAKRADWKERGIERDPYGISLEDIETALIKEYGEMGKAETAKYDAADELMLQGFYPDEGFGGDFIVNEDFDTPENFQFEPADQVAHFQQELERQRKAQEEQRERERELRVLFERQHASGPDARAQANQRFQEREREPEARRSGVPSRRVQGRTQPRSGVPARRKTRNDDRDPRKPRTYGR